MSAKITRFRQGDQSSYDGVSWCFLEFVVFWKFLDIFELGQYLGLQSRTLAQNRLEVTSPLRRPLNRERFHWLQNDPVSPNYPWSWESWSPSHDSRSSGLGCLIDCGVKTKLDNSAMHKSLPHITLGLTALVGCSGRHHAMGGQNQNQNQTREECSNNFEGRRGATIRAMYRTKQLVNTPLV